MFLTRLLRNPAVSITQLEDMLSADQNWYDQNSLKVNPTKTEMMIFGLPKRENQSSITVSFAGVQVRPVNNMKVLGVTLESELRWEDHVSTMIRKIVCDSGWTS